MRETFLPFSLPTIEQEEIDEVVDSLRSGWITTGPKVQRFEEALKGYVGARHVVATNSCTSGLLLCLKALGIGPGDEVVTTPLTFAATVNMIVAAGATPVLADIHRDTLEVDAALMEKAITPRTKALLPVHFAGQPVDLDAIRELARRRGLHVIEDAAHAIGTEYKGRKVGSDSRLAVFSFHPIKNITTGEGGAVCVNDDELADRIRVLRFHGLSKEAWNRYSEKGVSEYEILEPGWKFNMLDLQAAIGLHQLPKLERFLAARRALAERYQRELAGIPGLILPRAVPWAHRHAWHLYTPLLDLDRLRIDRRAFMAALKERRIGTGIHYLAIQHHPHYRKALGLPPGALPNADFVSPRIVSLPLYPRMTERDQSDTIAAIRDVVLQAKA
jgi:dTDP-4-amino-4,6-dideoxygalactose transaminase